MKLLSYLEANRYPEGIIKYLYDKVVELCKSENEIDIKVSDAISLPYSPNPNTACWEHGMSPPPQVAFIGNVNVVNTDDFNVFIQSIDETNVKYTYVSKGAAEAGANIHLIAIRDNTKKEA